MHDVSPVTHPNNVVGKEMAPSIDTCLHFGECGGCRFQDVDYATQLSDKFERLENLRRGTPIPEVIQPIIPSPAVWHYRNKMEFTFSEKNGHVICGLHHRERKKEVIDLKECRIFSPDVPMLLAAIGSFVRESGLPAYDPFTRRGFWRNLVLREEKFGDRMMVNLVTTSQGEAPWEKFIEGGAAVKTAKSISSLLWTRNDRRADAVVPEAVSLLKGKAFLEEVVNGLIFRIFPYSFFQVNPYLLEEFSRRIGEYARLTGKETVLDVFCGMGPISLALARRAKAVWGIEKEESTVDNARANAELNGIENATFIPGEAKRVLLDNREAWLSIIDVAIINPPRSGMGKKVVKRMLEIAPRTILYSSCRPETFFPEAQAFLDAYRIELIQPFDFFPHTPHLEVVGVFRRK